MVDREVLAAIRWHWAPWLPERRAALYRPSPSRVAINPRWWARHSPTERRELVVHEIGHHQSGATYQLGRANAGGRALAEARAERAGMRWWVPDAAVHRAVQAGCRETWQFACRWGVTEGWALKRLELFRVQHPQAMR